MKTLSTSGWGNKLLHKLCGKIHWFIICFSSSRCFKILVSDRFPHMVEKNFAHWTKQEAVVSMVNSRTLASSILCCFENNIIAYCGSFFSVLWWQIHPYYKSQMILLEAEQAIVLMICRDCMKGRKKNSFTLVHAKLSTIGSCTSHESGGSLKIFGPHKNNWDPN